MLTFKVEQAVTTYNLKHTGTPNLVEFMTSASDVPDRINHST